MRSALPFLLGITFCSAVAVANPVLLETFRVRQVPNTTHVQLTYIASSSSLTGISVTWAKRNGSALVGDWTPTSSISTNLGSGVRDEHGYQYCDCNMSVGAHSYEISVEWATSTTRATSLSSGVTVVTDYTGPAPVQTGGTTGAGGTMPWDEPEPTAMQGIDCALNCQANNSGAGGAAGTGGASTTAVTGGANTIVEATGGTTLVATATGGTIPVATATGGTTLVATATGGTIPIATATGGTSPVTTATGGARANPTQSKPDDSGCSLTTRALDRYGMAWLVLVGATLLLRHRR